MARLLALEWDQREARIVVGNTRGGRLLVEQAFSLPLAAGDEASVGAKIRAALDERRLPKLECLVAVGRTNIELKYLSLPPAPDEELPDLVRFQAQREFNTLGEDWALDFIPLDSAVDQPRKVLAAAISPRLVEQIRETCQAAEVEPQRLVLRPCAAASLLFRQPGLETEAVRLLVDPLGDEVDLTVLSGQTVMYLRTARLSSEVSGDDPWRPLVNEIRRTIAAAQNQLGAERVEAIYFCGDERQHAPLARQIEQELQLPAHVFDPFSQVDRSGELKSDPPAQPGRFAPLLGMLRDEAEQVRPSLDFFHPRRKPQPKRQTGRWVGAAAAALGVAVLSGLAVWWQLTSLDEQIVRLAEQSKAMDQAVKQAADIEVRAAEIDAWAAPDVVWLDELNELSKRFPPAADAVLTQVIASSSTGGQIQLEGFVRTAATIEPLEKNLRDERHAVEGKGSQQEDRKGRYSWKFKTNVVVAPQSGAPPAARPAPRRPAPAARKAGS